ncbi:MAG: hypothetical protein VKN60_00685 [Cyanobacteriota bacterium]|nr:hypothetical protein [Cyanobacteriota bacterium]
MLLSESTEPSSPNPSAYVLGGLGAGAIAAQTIGGIGLVGFFERNQHPPVSSPTGFALI